MLTVNINLQDKLANCQLGTSKHISIDTKSNVTKIYIKFDDSKAGLKKKNTDAFAKTNYWIPVEKTEVNIRMKSTATSSPVIRRTVSINASTGMYSS